MRTKRQRLAAVTLIGGLTTLGIGLTAGAASANVNDCSGYVGNAQSGSLHLTGNPAANSSVPAGSSISLDASWTKTDFNETDRLFVCGSVDGVFNPAMSAEDKGVGNDGSASASTTVPAGTAAGSNVCVVSVLRGQFPTTPVSQGEMVSDTLCYTAAAAVTTTTMAPTTTTTVAPAVEPTVDPVNTGAGDTSAPAAPAPAVSGEVAAAPAPMPVLPRTGSGIDVLAGFGGAALALGGLGRFLGRKRSAEA